MENTRHSSVFLDLSHLDAAHVRKRFPGIARTCAEFGIDIAVDPIPVRPGAHYMVGGVTIDHDGRTTLPGLWAAGEVTSSGLHGANRLASNSLLEGLVFGARAGAGASAAAADEADSFRAIRLENAATEPPSEPLDLVDIRNALKSLMWRSAGVRRSAPKLAEAVGTIRRWCAYALHRQLSDPEGWELQNMLTVASLVVDAALAREESRGVHLRTDFPETDDAHWQRHLSVARGSSTTFG
jgi:L-aspartate oxidase